MTTGSAVTAPTPPVPGLLSRGLNLAQVTAQGLARTAYVIGAYHLARLRGRPSLTDIMNYYGSDKGTVFGYGRRFFGGHDYADVYSRHFRAFRERAIVVLEVGIGLEGPGAMGSTVSTRNQGGASLRAWRDYFGRAHIYGVDINEGKFLDGPRLTTFVGDQASHADLEAVVAAIGLPLDIVIDDGSHVSWHQQLSLGCLASHVADRGLYVIEDLDTQPAHLERPGDTTTRELLVELERTGRFESAHLSADENQYVACNFRVVELFESGGSHRGSLAVLRKDRPSSR